MFAKLCLFFLPIVVGLNLNAKTFVSDYFSFKGARFVSYLHCDVHTSKIIIESIISKNISVNSLPITNTIKSWQLDHSLRQRLAPVGVLLDSECASSKTVLFKASQIKLFDSTHMWLVVGPELNASVELKQTYINDNFMNLNLSVDTDVAVSFYKDAQYELLDIFNFGKIQGNPLEVIDMGKWSEETGLQVYIKGFKYYYRWNFNNLTLRAISVILGKPRDSFTPDVLTNIGYTEGISAMTKITSIVLNVIKEKHNFRFNYTIVDRWVGSPVKNSSLAVTNSMYWKQQDISSTCLRIFSNWLDWMDPFFPPITYLETKFYYRIPNTGIGDYENRFLQPLSPSVWWCSLAAFVVCGSLLTYAAFMEKRPGSVSYAVFSVTAAACQQEFVDGEQTTGDSISSQGRRLILFVLGCSSMLLYNFYTSSVVSWLLNAAPPTIANIDGLIKSNLELVFEDIGYTRSWLESPGFYYYSGFPWLKEDELREKKVTKAKRSVELLQSADDGIELVRKGGFAYHTEPYNANKRISSTFDEEMLCELGALQMMNPAQVFMVGQRNSPYRQFFIWSMFRAAERGHISYARRRISIVAPECAGGMPRALSLGQAAPAFLVLTYGFLASILILLIELLCHRQHRAHRYIP